MNLTANSHKNVHYEKKTVKLSNIMSCEVILRPLKCYGILYTILVIVVDGVTFLQALD